MGLSQKKHHETTAHGLAYESLNHIKRLFIAIGHPLYQILLTLLQTAEKNTAITGLFKETTAYHKNKKKKRSKKTTHISFNLPSFVIFHHSKVTKRLLKVLKETERPSAHTLNFIKTHLDRSKKRIVKTSFNIATRNTLLHKLRLVKLTILKILVNELAKCRNDFEIAQTFSKKLIKVIRTQTNKTNLFVTSSIPPHHRKRKTFSTSVTQVLHLLPAHTKKIQKKAFPYFKKFRKDIPKFVTKKASRSRKSIFFSPFILLAILGLKFRLLLIALLRFPRFTLRRSAVLLASFLLVTLVVSLSGYLTWIYVTFDLPSVQDLTTRKFDVTTKIYDRNGLLLYKIYADQNRTPVKLVDIPSHVILSTLAIEDAEFYSHPGFSIRGIIRSAKRNIQRGEVTGGSTITQQLVKNTLLSSEKTYIRKLRELILAVQVELNFSKNEILEMYLSEVSFGGTAYGIQEAARMYFDKDVGDLTLAEAAILAGIPRSPTHFSPFGSHPEAAVQRQKEVLRLMEINGYITHEVRREAEEQKVTFASNRIDIKAPHFVMYVKEQLEKQYGKEVVERGGLSVITTLDYDIQVLAEKIVAEEAAKLVPLNATNAAAIVMNPKTGEILAMVGSKNYFDTQADGNVNVTTALRQPGSSIKVINYAYALSHGYTPATIILDAPAAFLIKGQPPYTPKNYDGGFRGNISIRSALAESRNIPAVKLLDSYGVQNMLELGKKMGITTWSDTSRYGLSLTLGGGEVKLIDLAHAYATIANYGKRSDLTTIIKATNYTGRTVIDNRCIEKSPLIAEVKADEYLASSSAERNTTLSECFAEQVLEPAVAYQLIDILKDNQARSPAFGNNSMLVIPNHPEVAVKTGTSNDLRDNLTVGFSQDYLVAVWVGNNDNSPMSRIASGVTGAAPIFNRVITALVSNAEMRDWQIPQGLVQMSVCTFTGTLPCEGCPTKTEWFLDSNKPQNHCSPDYFKKHEFDSKIAEDKNSTNQSRSRVPQR